VILDFIVVGLWIVGGSVFVAFLMCSPILFSIWLENKDEDV